MPLSGTKSEYQMNEIGLARFFAKAILSDGCLVWRGRINEDGYGWFRFNGTMRPAHKVAYQHFVGPVPKGLELDHLCRNRACVNHHHVEPVTHQENVARGLKVVTHCKRGHELTPGNFYQRLTGRYCKRCACMRSAQRHARRREVRSDAI